jgi:hypothetical protein
MKLVRRSAPAPRAWYLDAIAALAFIALTLFCGKSVARALGPFGGIIFLAFTGGFGYLFGRAAWNGLMDKKSQ